MAPSVTSPTSTLRRPEIALRVVLLPAPFAPRRAMIPPSGTSKETPLRTRITSWYLTSTLFNFRIGCIVSTGLPLFYPVRKNAPLEFLTGFYHPNHSLAHFSGQRALTSIVLT